MSDMWVPTLEDTTQAQRDAAAAWQADPANQSHYRSPDPSYNEGVLVPGTERTINPFTGQIVPVAGGGSTTAALPRGDAGTAKNLLRQGGLDELIPMVDGWIQDGLTNDQIEALLYDRTSDAGKVVDRLYPELRLRQEAGKKPMTITQIQGYKQSATQLLHQEGIGFLATPDMLQKALVGDVSLNELQGRAVAYSQVGAQLAASPEAASQLEAFDRYYGYKPTPAEVAAMAFNSDIALPEVSRRINAVKLDATAGQAGFGDLAKTEAEHLADLGVSTAQANQGFGQLGADQQLFTGLPGEAADSIGRDTQLAATFDGDAGAARRIRQRRGDRTAAFSGGGGFASTQAGATGVGTAF